MIDMVVPDIATFCAHLKEEREKREITLESIVAETRINIRFFVAIEAGNFSLLQDVYVRIFLRNYIRFIGLDVDELLKEFDILQGTVPLFAEAEEVVEPHAAESQDEEHESDVSFAQPSASSIKKGALFILVAGVILLLGYFFLGRMDSPSSQVADVPAPQPEVPQVVASTPVVPAPVLVTNLSVQLKALKYIWVLAVADNNKTLQSGFLQAGSVTLLEADSLLHFKIGENESRKNAINLTLNNDDLGEWGAPRTRLTKFNLTINGVDSTSLVSRRIRKKTSDKGSEASSVSLLAHSPEVVVADSTL